MLISDSDVQMVRDVVGADPSDALIRGTCPLFVGHANIPQRCIVIAALKKYKNEKNNAIVALLEGSIKVCTTPRTRSNDLTSSLNLQIEGRGWL
jgi:hypothetical protein